MTLSLHGFRVFKQVAGGVITANDILVNIDLVRYAQLVTGKTNQATLFFDNTQSIIVGGDVSPLASMLKNH